MSQYNYSTSYFTKEMLPISFRQPIIESYLTDLLSPMQRINDLFANDYLTGCTYSSYYTSSTYNIGDRITSGYDRKLYIYESLTASNLNNALNLTNCWMPIIPSPIGVEERMSYCSNKIILEWSLNRYFKGTFSQPGTGVSSSIFIEDNNAIITEFIVGYDETDSSSIGYDSSSGYIFATNSPGNWVNNYNYIVWVDHSLYGSTFSNLSGGSQSIKNFTNKYNTLGVSFDVVSY